MKQYLDLLGRVLSTAVKPQVKHLEGMGELFTTSFNTLTLTEKGYMLSAMMMGTRRVKKSIDDADREQKNTLLLKADFDAREVKGSLDAIIGKLDAYISPPSEEEEDADLEDMLDADNTENLLSADERSGSFKQMRIYLLTNYYNIFSKMRESVRRADVTLTNLSQLQLAIENDKNKRKEIWDGMKDEYKALEWPDQEATLIYRIKQEIADDENKRMTKIQILERELKRLTIDHISEIHKRELKELNQTVIDSKHTPVDVVMKYRDKLIEEDISDYFCFFYSYEFIMKAKESILLREAAQFDLLFYNKAAQEYVETLIPVLKQYGGLNDKGHYGILKIVLQELGLANSEKGNGIQMMDFVNEQMINDESEKLASQDSITNMTGKLNKKKFARLGSEGLGRTKINDKEYARMKDVYWRCFTILNYYRLVDINEVDYDGYLALPHPFTKTNDPWEIVDTDTKNRLTFLAFVLRGEGTKF